MFSTNEEVCRNDTGYSSNSRSGIVRRSIALLYLVLIIYRRDVMVRTLVKEMCEQGFGEQIPSLPLSVLQSKFEYWLEFFSRTTSAFNSPCYSQILYEYHYRRYEYALGNTPILDNWL